MITIGDLLAIDSLGLRSVGPVALERVVRRALVTEFIDPRRLLAGGELVMTSGSRQASADDQTQFVHHLVDAQAAVLGFVVGPGHEQVPRPTLTVARQHRLPILEIPVRTSFDAISGQIPHGDGSAQEKHLLRLLEAQQTMSQILLAGGGLSGLVGFLHNVTNAATAIVVARHRVLATSPLGYDWHLDDVSDTITVCPVELPGVEAAVLCRDTKRSTVELLLAVGGLVGLELARLRAEKAGRRELIGQVLEDIVRSVLSSSEAAVRLSTLGMDAGAAHSVLLTVGRAGDSLQVSASSLLVGLDVDATMSMTASIGPYTAVLLQNEEHTPDIADGLSRIGDPFGNAVRPVGVGGPYHGVDGLRWAFLEAREAVARGPGVHERRAISMPRLLMSSPDLPVHEVGNQVLRSLIEHDREHSGELLNTLAAYLRADGSPQLTAQALFVHRNTVRYRLEQIEHLTGRSLTNTESRVHLWLALFAIGKLGPGEKNSID